MTDKKQILIVFGTRPETIKVAPIIKRLLKSPTLHPVVCNTGQHRELTAQALNVFDIQADFDLDVMRENQSLPELTSHLLNGLKDIFHDIKPDFCLVQGDTASAFSGALAAFYAQVPVGHVEAGLRTYKKYHPYPEEMNRQLISRLATLHFAPTQQTVQNLYQEGIDPQSCFLTGNTAIDAIKDMVQTLGTTRQTDGRNRTLLVTAHRRENFGQPFENICKAILEIAQCNSDLEIVYALHPNPNVRQYAETYLSKIPNVRLIQPPDYRSFVSLLQHTDLILTDSGGLQEEAPVLNIPVLVLREETERTEAVEAGTVRLVGTQTQRIIDEVNNLLNTASAYQKIAQAQNPYGDGDAAEKIIKHLNAFFTPTQRTQEWTSIPHAQ